jgi:hypothetical protein
MKVKTTIHIFCSKFDWEKEGRYHFYSVKLMDTDHQTYVGSKEMEIEIPDDYDPTAQKIAALQKEKEQAQTEFAQKVAQINERISKLQALEYTA